MRRHQMHLLVITTLVICLMFSSMYVFEMSTFASSQMTTLDSIRVNGELYTLSRLHYPFVRYGDTVHIPLSGTLKSSFGIECYHPEVGRIDMRSAGFSNHFSISSNMKASLDGMLPIINQNIFISDKVVYKGSSSNPTLLWGYEIEYLPLTAVVLESLNWDLDVAHDGIIDLRIPTAHDLLTRQKNVSLMAYSEQMNV